MIQTRVQFSKKILENENSTRRIVHPGITLGRTYTKFVFLFTYHNKERYLLGVKLLFYILPSQSCRMICRPKIPLFCKSRKHLDAS